MTRENILNELWQAQDAAFELTTEYDSLPHYYGNCVLYQAEAYMLSAIGNTPGITTSELAKKMSKTMSACSQVIKKLVNKGLVIQEKNAANKRVYNLSLTDDGKRICKSHVDFNRVCRAQTFEMLTDFSDEELTTAIRVQHALNKAYQKDVELTKRDFT